MKDTALIFSGYFVTWGIPLILVALLGVGGRTVTDVGGGLIICLVPPPVLAFLAGAVFLYEHLSGKRVT